MAADRVLTCMGPEMPRNYLRTEEMFENFVLELEWKLNSPKGNSGCFFTRMYCRRRARRIRTQRLPSTYPSADTIAQE